MTASRARLSTTALALCLAATVPAHADVTPAQVWEDLETYVESFGYTVNATETARGDDLVITDAVFAVTLPEEQGDFSFTMSEVTLSDTGDGSVRVSFPETMPIAAEFTTEDGETVEMVVDYTHRALDMVVSGDPDALVYTYSADSLALALAELVVDGTPVTHEMFRFDASAGPVEGISTVIATGETREIAQEVSMGELAYDMTFNDPDSEDTGLVSGGMTGLSFEGTSTIPAEFSPEMMQNIMAAGMFGAGTLVHQGGNSQFAVTEDGETTSGRTTSESATIKLDVNAETLGYDIAAAGLTMNLAGGEIPLPVDLAMDRVGLVLEVPTAPSDTPRDMALGLTLGGFTMSDLLWNIFDPGGVLPRDPATVAFDLAGKVTPFVSIYDADAMAQLEKTGGMPGELNALTLESLTIEAAGAQLTGTGAMTFDNSDTETFDGLPRPDGAVELQLSGANTLIDRLIQMGLVREQDAMGARMMLSMFAVPGEGEDVLNSRLEINEQGHVLANGQRIK